MIAVAMCFCITSLKAQTKFQYEGRAMTSSAHCLYVKAGTKTVAKRYTFGSVNEALRYAETQASDTEWTDIYIEPSVYWIDNPDNPEVLKPAKGSGTPYGMEVSISRTRLIGMSTNAEDVVLASSRGQTQGADGNFTMFHIIGDSIEARNITFGNYCNVDLIYPRNPKLNRKKRKDAIVQAQLVICKGDGYRLENCRFISRLNLCPFAGGKHVDFDKCYFECTDDALCGTGTYRNCSFTFYSSKPFYTTSAQGATFIDCDIHTKVRGTQYLTKVSGPVFMQRCRWTSDDPNLTIEWAKRPEPRNYCAMIDCTLNGKPLNVPTPTEPLPLVMPAVGIAVQPEIIPGQWTIDCHKPKDLAEYPWQPDNSRSAWGYAEGVDGAEGAWGMVQLQRGARLMFTPKNEGEKVGDQECTVTMEPCKGPGQGFGSATGQYLDICIKFDTRTLTGYGLRFIRTPEYDKAVETYLVEYANGDIHRISNPMRCDAFRPGCAVTLTAKGNILTARIDNEKYPETSITLTAEMPHPNTFGGFHLQHTGSTGASATVIKAIRMKEQEATSASGYVPVAENGRIYYEIQGKGEPLLLLHGHTLDRRMWRKQVDVLSQRYKVITIDFRGYGLSSKQKEFMNTTHLDDLLTVMDTLGIEKAHVIGLSMGGFVAGDMLGMHPERMLSCVMCSGAIRSKHKGPHDKWDDKEIEECRATIEKTKAQGIENWRKEWIEQLITKGGSRQEDIRKDITEMIMDWDCFQLTNIEPRLYYGHEAMEALMQKRPDVPTMYLSGETEHKKHMGMLNYLSNSKQIELPDCGHMSNMEQPELFNKAILDFLNELK